MWGRSAFLAVVAMFACGPEGPEEVSQTPPSAGIYRVAVTVLEDSCEPRTCDARRNDTLTVGEDGRMIVNIAHQHGELWSVERVPFDPDPETSGFRYAPFDYHAGPECGGRRWLLEVEEATADALTVRETERVVAECGAVRDEDCSRVTLHEFTLQTACEPGDCPAHDYDVTPLCE